MILDGGLGNDIFNINAILTGSLSGNTGSDTLAGTLIDNATITNLDVNGADGTEASITALVLADDSAVGDFRRYGRAFAMVSHG